MVLEQQVIYVAENKDQSLIHTIPKINQNELNAPNYRTPRKKL